jgi:DNA-binding beta-propeller fold protein YncE
MCRLPRRLWAAIPIVGALVLSPGSAAAAQHHKAPQHHKASHDKASQHHKKAAPPHRSKKTTPKTLEFTAAHYKVEQILGPSLLHGIQGIAFAPDGSLYVGSLLGRSISKIDRTTGAVTPYLGSPRGSAGDLAFAPDGTVAWAAVRDNAVFMRTRDRPIKTAARDVPGVRAVGFSKNGRLYFSRIGEEVDGLYEVDPNDPDEPRLVTANVGGLGPFQIDDKGTLFGAALFRRALVKIDLASGEMAKIVDGFTSPGAVRLGRDGAPIVLDRRTGDFIRVDVDEKEKSVIAHLDPPVDTFAIAKDGMLFAANAAFSTVTAIDPHTKEPRQLTKSELSAPGMIAIVPKDDGEDLIVADSWGARRVDPKSGTVTLIGSAANSTNAASLAVRSDGTLVLGNEWPTGSIQIVDRETGAMRANLSNFGAPYGIAPVDDGFVAADYVVGRLTKVADDEFHTRTTVAWGFDGPLGLVAAGDGVFYVSEYDAGKITRVVTPGNDRSTVISGLRAPEGIALAPDNRLIVAEVGARRVLAVNLSTGTAEILADNLGIGLAGSGSGPNLPTGVAVGKDGAIYVTGDVGNVLYRLTRPEPPAKDVPAAKDAPSPKDDNPAK